MEYIELTSSIPIGIKAVISWFFNLFQYAIKLILLILLYGFYLGIYLSNTLLLGPIFTLLRYVFIEIPLLPVDAIMLLLFGFNIAGIGKHATSFTSYANNNNNNGKWWKFWKNTSTNTDTTRVGSVDLLRDTGEPVNNFYKTHPLSMGVLHRYKMRRGYGPSANTNFQGQDQEHQQERYRARSGILSLFSSPAQERELVVYVIYKFAVMSFIFSFVLALITAGFLVGVKMWLVPKKEKLENNRSDKDSSVVLEQLEEHSQLLDTDVYSEKKNIVRSDKANEHGNLTPPASRETTPPVSRNTELPEPEPLILQDAELLEPRESEPIVSKKAEQPLLKETKLPVSNLPLSKETKLPVSKLPISKDTKPLLENIIIKTNDKSISSTGYNATPKCREDINLKMRNRMKSNNQQQQVKGIEDDDSFTDEFSDLQYLRELPEKNKNDKNKHSKVRILNSIDILSKEIEGVSVSGDILDISLSSSQTETIFEEDDNEEEEEKEDENEEEVDYPTISGETLRDNNDNNNNNDSKKC